jgi:hypothetical protein
LFFFKIIENRPKSLNVPLAFFSKILVLSPFFYHHFHNQEEQQTRLDAGVDCGPFVNRIQHDQTKDIALHNKKLRRLLMNEEDLYLGSNYNGNFSKRNW